MKLIEATILARGQQNWIEVITDRYRARLRLLQSKPSRKRDEVLQLLEIIVDSKAKEELLGYLRNDPEISNLKITDSSHGRLTGIVTARGAISRCIADSDCFLLDASNESDPVIAWRVLGTERSFKGLLTRLVNRDIKFRIGEKTIISNKGRVTARQEWVLQQAFERGYYDIPKRIHIRALARQLKISHPALHESLRLTQRKLLEEHFGKTKVIRSRGAFEKRRS